MHLIVHKSQNSKQKFILKYDVNSKEFSIENEEKHIVIIKEGNLFNWINEAWLSQLFFNRVNCD